MQGSYGSFNIYFLFIVVFAGLLAAVRMRSRHSPFIPLAY